MPVSVRFDLSSEPNSQPSSETHPGGHVPFLPGIIPAGLAFLLRVQEFRLAGRAHFLSYVRKIFAEKRFLRGHSSFMLLN